MRLKGFKIGNTGYSVNNIVRKKRGNTYYYYFNLKGPRGGVTQHVEHAKRLQQFKNKLANGITKKGYYG